MTNDFARWCSWQYHILPGYCTCNPRTSSSSSYSWRVRSVILFLNPQDEVGPSTSSLVVPCSFVLSVYIVMLVLVVYLCPSSVRVVATFSGIVLFPLLYSILCAPVFSLIHWFCSLSNFVIPSKYLKNFICAASKSCSSLFFSTQASLPNFSAAFAVMLCILNFVSLFICFPKCLCVAPFILLYVCNLSSKSLLYSDIQYPKYLKYVTYDVCYVSCGPRGDGVHSTKKDRIKREASKLKGKIPFERRRGGVIGIVTKLQNVKPRNRGLIPDRGQGVYLFSKASRTALGSTIQYNRFQELLLRG